MTPFLSAYLSLIDSKKIKSDPAQKALVEELDCFLAATLPILDKHNQAIYKRFFKQKPKEPLQGIYIHGEVGRGKSMLMSLLYDHLPSERKTMIHFHQMMEMVHSTLFTLRSQKQSASKLSNDAMVQVARSFSEKYSIIFVDELHITEIGDAMLVSRFFSLLIDQGVLLVITSNRAPEHLYLDGVDKQYFADFIRLLGTHLQVFSLNALHDYRTQKQPALQSHYFAPLGEEATHFIENWKKCLLKNAEPELVILHTHGRDLPFHHCVHGALMVKFADLCQTTLGPGDYLLIAEAFHTIVMEEIPQLTAENRNEAKRFVTLIDHLYQEKCRFICSAAVEPEHLYEKGDGKFEFARTVSRLHEMQSETYLAHSKNHNFLPKENAA